MNKLSRLADVPPGVVRNIGDKLNVKRKNAALEIEQLVKKKVTAGESNDEILLLVDTLLTKYGRPNGPVNQRKGCLLCLAAVAVGLSGTGSMLAQSDILLDRLLPPILSASIDSDGRVRYYALEALYNVVKSTRPRILDYLPKIFDTLFRLCDDPDTSMQNATVFVSDLLKDSISAAAEFRLDSLLQTLVNFLPVESSNKRRFLLGWVSFIDSLPSVGDSFAVALPDIVAGLLAYLGDPVPEVRHPTEKMLGQLLEDILNKNVAIQFDVLAQALCELILSSEDEGTSASPGIESGSIAVKAATLRWLEELVDHFVDYMAFSYPKILKTCLKCMDSIDYGVQDLALELNRKLQATLSKVSSLDYLALLDVAVQKIGSTREIAKLEALKWTAILMKTDNIAAKQIKPLLLHCLCEALVSNADEVVEQAVEVLSALSAVDSDGLSLTMGTIIRVFEGPSGSLLLQRRGTIILEKLCDMMTAKRLLTGLVNQLRHLEDKGLVRMIIQALNLLLLTSGKMMNCRVLLSKTTQDKEASTFMNTLFNGFASSVSASLSLALLSKQYELASLMVEALADESLISGMTGSVVELSQLVLLLESPAFASMRLNMIEVGKYPALLRAMFSILMLLPQGDAFLTLSKRISILPQTKSSDVSVRKVADLTSKERELLDVFMRAQAMRVANENKNITNI